MENTTMTKHVYTAKFANDITETREFARVLTHAWRAEYTVVASGLKAVKHGFSMTKAAAEKAVKFAKRYTVDSFEIVEVTQGEEVTSKAKTTPKKAKVVKPFAAGEAVTVQRSGVTVHGTVAKVGRLYVYVTLPGFKKEMKLAFADVSKPAPEFPAQALAA
jgi:hypothetical protein